MVKNSKRLADLSPLLKDTLLSFYWLGFLLADGHFSKEGRLIIQVSEKDKEHLTEFLHFVNGKCNIALVQSSGYGGENFRRLSIMHSDIVKKLCEKYEIYSNKTTNPPNINNIEGDFLTAMKIGFINGDGSINKQSGNRRGAMIRIKCHASWLDNLHYMFGNCKVNKEGYAISTISKHSDCKDLKRFALLNDLPMLARKWNEIDMNWISKYELAEHRVEFVRENKHMKNIDIASILEISPSAISLIRSRNNISNE